MIILIQGVGIPDVSILPGPVRLGDRGRPGCAASRLGVTCESAGSVRCGPQARSALRQPKPEAQLTSEFHNSGAVAATCFTASALSLTRRTESECQLQQYSYSLPGFKQTGR